MLNPYEDAGRLAKVVKLAAVAKQHGVTAGDFAVMLDEQWAMLEQAAGTWDGKDPKKRASQTTREVATQTYRNVEAAAARTPVKFPKF